MKRISPKRILSLGLAAILTLSLAACGGDQTTETQEPSQPGTPESQNPATLAHEVKIATNSDPGSLGAFDEGSSSGRWTVLAYTYENLAAMDVDGSYKGIIAKDWHKVEEKSADGAWVYEIELYDYVKDSAGNPITANDVVFSFKECLENGTGNQHTTLVGFMTDIVATGDYTVEITVSQLNAGKLEGALTSVMIVNEQAYKDSGDCMRSKPIATGPYIVDEWVTGSSLTLVKNENYWQKPELCIDQQKQNVDKIIYYFVVESAQVAIGLETGTYDVATTLNYTNASRFMEGGASADGFRVEAVRDTFIQQMWINRSEESPLHDLRIAQAVLYAIDREGLVTAVMEGRGELNWCYGSDLSIGYQEKWEQEDYYNYDLEKAKSLLAEAGVKEGDLNLTILCDTDEVHSKIAQVVQAMLGQVGITCEVTAFEQSLWNTFQTDPTKFDLNISYNGATGYVTNTWGQLDSTRYAEHNMAMVRDNKLDTLIGTAAVSQDPADIDAAKQYMTENAYHYGLFHKMLNYVTNSDLITEAVWNTRSNFVPGASTYIWN